MIDLIMRSPATLPTLSKKQAKYSRGRLQALAISGCLGVLAFPICINTLQRLVWKPLRLTSNLKAAPLFGNLMFSHT